MAVLSKNELITILRRQQRRLAKICFYCFDPTYANYTAQLFNKIVDDYSDLINDITENYADDEVEK